MPQTYTEHNVLKSYIAEKGIRNSSARESILNVFLHTERHVSAAELFELVRKKHPTIGIATVYRTVKLLCGAGLAEEIDFGDGMVRYEHKHGHEHHDHLICTKCGRFIEAFDPTIEELQKRLADKHGFQPLGHSLRITGYCKECRT
jgi:Fur family ferric uptake transcriptional regulator